MLYNKSFEAYFYNLIWQVETGRFQGPLCLKIRTSKFQFPEGLSQETLLSILKKANSLYVCCGNSNLAAPLDEDLVLLTRFLYTKKIPFKLKYNWNKDCSIKYNITHLTMPRKIDRMVRKQYQESPPPWLQESEEPQWQNTAPNAETQCSTSQPT